MHVGGITVDLNWFLQLILTVFIIAFGLLHLVKNTASKYFEVDANFEGGTTTDRSNGHAMSSSVPSGSSDDLSCIVCGNPGSKKCSRCKSVRYWYMLLRIFLSFNFNNHYWFNVWFLRLNPKKKKNFIVLNIFFRHVKFKVFGVQLWEIW